MPFVAVPQRARAGEAAPATREALRLRERTGRLLGDARFVRKLEALAGRILRPRKPGPKKKK